MGERDRGLFERKVQRSTKGQGSIQASPTLAYISAQGKGLHWMGRRVVAAKKEIRG